MTPWVSSACVSSRSIADAVEQLARAGFSNIELTGGTEWYEGLLDDLIELRRRHGLRYQVHNYFPPPPVPFVLNLASCDNDLYRMSIEHVHAAASTSRALGITRYGVHAGFLIDIRVDEAGRRVGRRQVNDRALALQRFSEAFGGLVAAYPDMEIYIENNVVSAVNQESIGENAFLFTNYQSYLELQRHCPGARILLDLAHLKVSCHTDGLEFADQASRLLPLTDYFHVSDNNGLADTNQGLTEVGTDVLDVLRDHVGNQDITFEIYTGLDQVRASIAAVDALAHTA